MIAAFGRSNQAACAAADDLIVRRDPDCDATSAVLTATKLVLRLITKKKLLVERVYASRWHWVEDRER